MEVKVYFSVGGFHRFNAGEKTAASLQKEEVFEEYDKNIEVSVSNIEVSVPIEFVEQDRGHNVYVKKKETVCCIDSKGKDSHLNGLIESFDECSTPDRIQPEEEEEKQKEPVTLYLIEEEYNKYIKNQEAVAHFHIPDFVHHNPVHIQPDDFDLIYYRGQRINEIEDFDPDFAHAVVIKPKFISVIEKQSRRNSLPQYKNQKNEE